MVRLMVCITFVLACADAAAAAVTILSPHYPPTTNDLIHVGVPSQVLCSYSHEVTRDDTHIRIVISTSMDQCVIGPPAGPSVEAVALGRLPAGSYTIDAFTKWDDELPELVGSTSLSVIALVPALPLVGQVLLIAGIAMAGFVVSRVRV